MQSDYSSDLTRHNIAAEADDRPGPPMNSLRTTARQASCWVGRHHNIKTTTAIINRAQYVSLGKTRASDPLPGLATRHARVRRRYNRSDPLRFSQTRSDVIVRLVNPWKHTKLIILEMACNPIVLYGICTDYRISRAIGKNPQNYRICLKSVGHPSISKVKVLKTLVL